MCLFHLLVVLPAFPINGTDSRAVEGDHFVTLLAIAEEVSLLAVMLDTVGSVAVDAIAHLGQ